MPRKPREKNALSIYHIMCRSISEMLLFRESSDKDYYLKLLKKYIVKYHCSIYAYCLMNTHLHLHFDPRGFDVSRFMHSVNTAYVRYYNKKYSRHGHVFDNRFQSRILSTDEYNLNVSAYIHNNPHDIEGYAGKEHTYEYSSYGVYLNIRQDRYQIIDTSFIKGLFNISEANAFAIRYHEFVARLNDIKTKDEVWRGSPSTTLHDHSYDRNVVMREYSPSKVISYINEKLQQSRTGDTSERQKSRNFKEFTVYVLRVLCGLSYKEICNYILNIKISNCSRLCDRGFELTGKSPIYTFVFSELLHSPV